MSKERICVFETSSQHCYFCKKEISTQECPTCGYPTNLFKKYCNFCQKNVLVEKLSKTCPCCQMYFASSPENIMEIDTKSSIINNLNTFEKDCWERFIGTYRSAIIKYIASFLKKMGIKKDHLWMEEIVTQLIQLFGDGKIQTDKNGNIKFRYILIRKIKDIILQELRREKTKYNIELYENIEKNKEMDIIFANDILEEIHQRVIYSSEFNDYDRSVIKYARVAKELPDAKYLKEIWGITEANARQIIHRFRKRCKQYLGYIALGPQARKEEKDFIKNLD